MTILFEKEIETNFTFEEEEIAKKVIEEALAVEKFPYSVEVNITLTDEEGIQGINSEFRGIHKVTDVLSFPMAEYISPGNTEGFLEHIEYFHPDSGEFLLGDIVICVPRVYQQAMEYGHSIKREYAFLIAHSMFHLMGYDHMTEEEAKVMELKQEIVLDNIKITRESEDI